MKLPRPRTLVLGDALILIGMAALAMASFRFTWRDLHIGGYFCHRPVWETRGVK